MYHIHLLPASFGDSILIEYGTPQRPYYILIDGGPYYAFDEIDAVLKRDYKHIKKIELLVVTHIDIDHIDGIVVMLNQTNLKYKIEQVWFNGFDQINSVIKDKLGPKQGEYLSTLIHNKKIKHNLQFGGAAVCITRDTLPTFRIKGGMYLTLLSPDKSSLQRLKSTWMKTLEEAGIKSGDKVGALERLKKDKRYQYDPKDKLGDINFKMLLKHHSKGDKSAPNRSSIAFLARYKKQTCLFAGDTPSDMLVSALKRISKTGISVEAWKIAHHGSKNSTNRELMKFVECKCFLISSDGKKYSHPDKETIAKIIDVNGPNVHLYFNYLSPYNEDWNKTYLKRKHKYLCEFPRDNHSGIKVDVG